MGPEPPVHVVADRADSEGSWPTRYTAATGKQWTQPIGFAHALFEVAADVLKRTTDIDDKAAIRDAIKATNLDTIVGTGRLGQASRVAQRRQDAAGRRPVGQGHRDFPYDLVIVSNKDHRRSPTAGTMQPIP